MKGLTSHVLDTLTGMPAMGVTVALYQDGQCLHQARTDQFGRCQLASRLIVGTYEIHFEIGDYFADKNLALPDPAFLDLIIIRFSVADENRHYHIPLVASPWSYTTYKGGAPAHSP
jgi:5-hydroxyisourate hydrolase